MGVFISWAKVPFGSMCAHLNTVFEYRIHTQPTNQLSLAKHMLPLLACMRRYSEHLQPGTGHCQVPPRGHADPGAIAQRHRALHAAAPAHPRRHAARQLYINHACAHPATGAGVLRITRGRGEAGGRLVCVASWAGGKGGQGAGAPQLGLKFIWYKTSLSQFFLFINLGHSYMLLHASPYSLFPPCLFCHAPSLCACLVQVLVQVRPCIVGEFLTPTEDQCLPCDSGEQCM